MKTFSVLVSILLLFVAIDLPAQSEIYSNDAVYITDGYFRLYEEDIKEEIKVSYENGSFIALVEDMESGVFRLIPVNVKIDFGINDCTGDGQAILSAYNEEGDEISYLILIEGLKRYNVENIVFQRDESKDSLTPYENYLFTSGNIGYTLHATADTTEADYIDNSRNYKLYFQRGQTKQLLAEIEQLESCIPSIQFIGDIDGDDLPDLLLHEGYNYEYYKQVLYLSSFAEEGDLVKIAATDEEWRDC